MIGKIFDNAFRIRTYNRCICFLVGGAFTYSLANPDIDTVYEFFPIFKQNKFAYITFLQVDGKHDKIFEEKLKDLCRFYQKQQGYLYTKIIKEKKEQKEKKENKENNNISSLSDNKLNHLTKYIIISTWLKSENFLLATNRMYGQLLIKKIQQYCNYNPYLYKIVVDDWDYIPSL